MRSARNFRVQKQQLARKNSAPQKVARRAGRVGAAVVLASSLAACSAKSPALDISKNDSLRADAASSSNVQTSSSWTDKIFHHRTTDYAQSGSIVLSFQLPERLSAMMSPNLSTPAPLSPASANATVGSLPGGLLPGMQSFAHQRFAPLLGYFPPRMSKLPAENEFWIELDSKEKRLRVFQGKNLVEDVAIEGMSGIQPGDYLVQSKQSSPRWYAGDDYFTRRGLTVPSQVSENRYLKGALGNQALFLSETFAIHSSPVWTEEVGGVKVDRTVLSRIFDHAPIGVSVVVR